MKIELKPLNKINPVQLAYHANNPAISRNLRNSFPYPYTLEYAYSSIENSLNHHALNFGIVVDDECIGCVNTSFYKDIYIKNCEIGYWISQEYWGLGIARKVVHMLCTYLFKNYTITKICAEVFAENIASIHVLTANGFIQEGYLYHHIYKNGKYHDLVLFGLLEENYEY